MKGTAGPYMYSFSKGRPPLPIHENSLWQRGGRRVWYILCERSGRSLSSTRDSLYERDGRTIHISFFKVAAAPSSKYKFSVAKRRPLLQVKLEIPFIKGTARPYIYPFSRWRPLLPVNINFLWQGGGRSFR